MQFSHKEDIEAPLDEVFAALSDFDTIERSILRRGVEVARTDRLAGPCAGMTWRATFSFRGKSRDAEVVLSRFEPPTLMVFDSVSGGLETRTIVECVALSRSRTRVGIDTTLTAKTLSARLILQSMKLAKGRIDRKFKDRVASAATELERRLKRT
ncbi:Polyketide cyclase / dehydrase and lipid transport [Roseivivax halotolerans]|jgi:carbon monoxide dehydrogenase subunit G|uniref:Polyketide cyclase / dehydrase and lipid transport n=1 Tax=Roseivivax halotolerans TaxID=93684 RepID=A0A1I5ULI7_9RHOB|nr:MULTISPECIES: SRPBCC family protein [Roseivivax]QFT64521.1 Polyketide cyclase / dehydrase and lipid transport [Roseivivax sp. THAF30]SFP96068.1 Polyketide cyclase / dehydrase and lipid transport [Roseivivax halotolerans]